MNNLDSLLKGASFTPELFGEDSAWKGHLPFAAWLMEVFAPEIVVELGAHWGHSYFTFCQSVIDKKLATECYAVDTWQGEKHAGFYSEKVFDQVYNYNQEYYAGFSHLLRMTFDDAINHFSDGSIDLLHIDGLHTYEAVKHDFETWLPKLAPGCIVLFHDTRMYENDFGVWKFWQELEPQYPSHLEFIHSYGLGVLQLDGGSQQKRQQWLQRTSPAQQNMKDYFSALGSRQGERLELQQLQARLKELDLELINRNGQIADLATTVSSRDAHIIDLAATAASRDVLIADLTTSVSECDGKNEHLTNEIIALRDSTSWRITHPLRIIMIQLKRVMFVAKLVLPAVKYSGGATRTIQKAIAVFRRDGWSGVKRVLRKVAVSSTGDYFSLLPDDFLDTVELSADQLLNCRILIVAELSIPQCTKYRVTQKQEMLTSLGYDCTVVDWNDTVACHTLLATHSLLIFYRVPATSSLLSIVDEARRLKVFTCWETDDLIFDRDLLEESRSIAGLEKEIRLGLLDGAILYRNAMLACDAGIASTSGLAESMTAAGIPETFVVENALDVQTLSIAEKLLETAGQAERASDNLIRIVYGSGTDTHDVDFEEASTALLHILKQFKNVHLVIIGKLELSADFLKYKTQVERKPLCAYEDYLALVAQCHISIAPLEPCVFNDSKSNIKFLEAATLKIPSICSPRAAFVDAIINGVDGFLCASTKQWIVALTTLINDETLRHQVGAAAYELVMGKYAPSAIAQQQLMPLLDRHKQRRSLPRILAVNIYYAPRSFGGATIVAEQINEILNSSGEFDVHVVTALTADIANPYAVRRYQAKGVNVFGIVVPDSGNPKLQFENPAMIQPLTEIISAVQPDIVHFHCIQGVGVCASDLCSSMNIPYIITLHDAWWLCGRQFMIDRQGHYCFQEKIDLDLCASCVDDAKLNDYRQHRLGIALKNAARLLSPSRYFADFYIKNGFSSKKVTVNKNGIKKPQSQVKKYRGNPLRFGYVGGNTEIKGVHLVRQVFSDLVDLDVKLIVVDNATNLGFSTYEKGFFDEVSQVEIVPAYTQESIDQFFSSIDVLLFPTQWKESFGLTVREAIVRDVWVIVTDAGGVVDDIRPGKNGFIVPFEDTGEVFKQTILDTIEYFHTLNEGDTINLAKDHIAYFENQAAEVAQIYSDVLSQTSRNGGEP